MVFSVNTNSEKKQYIERDNLLLIDNDDIIRLDVNPENINFRMNPLFEGICGLLGLNDKESQLYYMVNYKKDECDTFGKMGKVLSTLFKCHPRSYYPYYIRLRKRGILTTNQTTGKIEVGKQFDISEFSKAKYIVLKINQN